MKVAVLHPTMERAESRTWRLRTLRYSVRSSDSGVHTGSRYPYIDRCDDHSHKMML